MKTVNALKIRTKFGEVLKELKKSEQPILVSKGRKIEAALIPIELFNRRFVDLLTEDAITAVLEKVNSLKSDKYSQESTIADLRAIRGELS